MDRTDALARLPDRIAFLGLGLIGGSIALALRAAGSTARLAAWTPSLAGPEEALRAGAIDEVAVVPHAAIADAGLVILAGPPLAVHAMLDDLGTSLRGYLAADATITDVASTKSEIGSRAIRHGLPYVGGHPMAGREASGYAAATADLFVDRPWVVVTGDDAPQRSVEILEALIAAVGARAVHMNGSQHDAAVAAISHLPLVVSAALVEAVARSGDAAVDWPAARALAAGGWRDMTRIARGDPEMGAGILATNGFTTAYHLRLLRQVIDRWIERLEAKRPIADPDPIRAALEGAREALLEEEPR